MSLSSTNPKRFVSYVGKTKLEYDVDTGALVMSRDYDHDRALIAEAIGYNGVSSYSASYLNTPTSYTTMNGRTKLVYDHKLNKLTTVGLDPAQEVLHQFADYSRAGHSRFQDEIDTLLANISIRKEEVETGTRILPAVDGRQDLALGCQGQSALSSSLDTGSTHSQRSDRKVGEIKAGRLCIPRRGDKFEWEKLSSMRQYFAVLRRRKFMVFNTESEYYDGDGACGTRASYVVFGCKCRIAASTKNYGFEIKFASGGGWLTFWTLSAEDAQRWVEAIIEKSS